MTQTQIFRNQLGLSQEMMAIYLNLTKSQLSMYEWGKRELPTAALEKLVEIAVFLNLNKTAEDQESKLQKEQKLLLKTFVDIQIKDLEYKHLKENRALEKILKKYKQNVELRAFALYLQKNKESLAEVLLIQANNGLKKYGLLNQTKHSLKIEGILSQLNYFKSLKEK